MISIIIVVKNDKRIEEVLKKLIKMPKPQKIEVIVIDSSEGTLDDIKKRFPIVRWIYYHNKKKKKITIPEQRNLGLKEAQGDIVAFIDADSVPDDNWILRLSESINEKEKTIISGSVQSIGGETIWDIRDGSTNPPKYLPDAGALNMIFRKDIIKEVGFFDENLECGEDIDFSWRAVDTGYKIEYKKDIIVYHDWGNLKQEIRRAFWYGKIRVKLYKKHPRRLKNLLSYDMVTLAYPLFIVALPLTLFWPFYPFLILIPIIKNIKRRPLKVVLINLIFGLGVLKGFFE